jgi:uncharacterized membrane protein
MVPVRAVIVLWFLLFCPGMAFVQLLQMDKVLDEIVLAVALSLALDLLVAMALLYAGLWYPNLILMIMVVLSQVGVLCRVLLWTHRRAETRVNPSKT